MDNDYPHKDNEIPINPTITPTKITITHKSNEILLATKKRHRGKLSAMAFFSCPAALFFGNAPKKRPDKAHKTHKAKNKDYHSIKIVVLIWSE